MNELLKDRLVTIAYLFLFALVILAACALAGCHEEFVRTPGNLDSLLDTVNHLAEANTASAPVNPYTFTIGIGLTGIAAILEALRRKEREGRKRAEQELTVNNNHA